MNRRAAVGGAWVLWLVALVSAAHAAEPPADLTKELSVTMKGTASGAGTPTTVTTLFTRLREHVEEIGDLDTGLFMAILGDCLSSSGVPGDVPNCTEFDAKDLAARAPAARQQLKGHLIRWTLSFDAGPASSEFMLGPFDFAKRSFPVELKGKLCTGTLGGRCVVPANTGMRRTPPQFEVRFDAPVKDEALARAIAALRPDQPGVTWSPTVELLIMPTGRVAPQAYRMKARVEDWIEARLVALRIVIEVPASVAAIQGRPPNSDSSDDEPAAGNLVEIVLADYYFK